MISKEIMRSDFITVDKNDTISRLIGKFRVSKRQNAVVLDGKKYAGIVCKRKLMKPKIKVDEEKIGKVMMKPAVLDGSETAERAAKLMFTSDVHMLPVVKSGSVKGVVYAIDVIEILADSFGQKKVSDVSAGKVIALDEHTEISNALSIMRKKKIDMAPLVTAKNKLSGIISLVDLFMKYSIFPGKRPGGHNVAARKSSPGKDKEASSVPVIYEATVDVVTVRPQDKLKTAVKLMAENHIADVVVLDEYNQPAGIITIKDLLKLF